MDKVSVFLDTDIGDDIDDTWARTEGEGDLSLEYWREVHIEFFNKYFPDFQETDWLELNEFVVI